MNANLERLKALVAETNEVVANLNKETEDIRNGNQEERAKKYAEIKDYLLECVDIAMSLGTWLKVKIDIPNFSYLHYPTEVFLEIYGDKAYPLKFRKEYTDSRGSHCVDHDRAFRDSVNGIDLPYAFNDHNSNNFIDNWNQEVFEKRFAAEIERAITEKAEAANKKYQSAIMSQEKLGR